MSPPEVWGPVIWTLFHTLSEKISEHSYNKIYPQLFLQFQKICKFLPCPECSRDASIFLEKIKIRSLKTKHDFKNLFYLFHNYVNAKKRKQLFNYANINIYKNFRIINVINRFFAHYNTKGNMKLLTESFQRQFIINDFKKWFSSNISAFFQPNIPSPINNSQDVPQIGENLENPVLEQVLEPDVETNEERVVEPNEEEIVESNEDAIEEPNEEAIVESNDVAIEKLNEEALKETNEEPVVETIKESFLEEEVEPIEEPDVEEEVETNEEPVVETIKEPDVEEEVEPIEEPDVEEEVETNEEPVVETIKEPDVEEEVEPIEELVIESNEETNVENLDEQIEEENIETNENSVEVQELNNES